jgi:hypothetical protein
MFTINGSGMKNKVAPTLRDNENLDVGMMTKNKSVERGLQE